MQPKKILHVIRPAEGGMKGHLLSLIKGLNNSAFEVSVACPEGSPMAEKLKKMGVNVYDIPLVGPIHFNRDLKCITMLKHLCKSGGFRLVHCHGSKAGMVGRVAASMADVPSVVLTAHNFVVDNTLNPLKKVMYTNGERFLGAITNRVITVSLALRDEYLGKFRVSPEKVVCIYNGINTQAFEVFVDKNAAKSALGLAHEIPVVGTVARLVPQKGIEFFLDAVSHLANRLNAQYLVAGDGPLRAALESKTRSLGLADLVRFPGYCPNIAEVLQTIDIFVIPSVSEGLSITAIEAMAAGKPIVASRVGGLPEVVEHNVTGLLVTPGDGKALAEAILSLMNNEERARQMGVRGKIIAGEKFCLNKMIKETEAVYSDLLN